MLTGNMEISSLALPRARKPYQFLITYSPLCADPRKKKIYFGYLYANSLLDAQKLGEKVIVNQLGEQERK